MSLHFDGVSFTHEGGSTPLFSRLSLHCDRGWTGIVGANGTGKTTLLRLALGELSPDEGTIRRPRRIACCPQRTDDPPAGLEAFLSSADPDGCRLRGSFGVDPAWRGSWGSLSHGERKRSQIAAALWTGPDALLLDEPTNHIDDGARLQLINGLRGFQGVGLLVSHDRELLDALCRQCAFVEPPVLIVRPGCYTEALRTHRAEDLAQQRVRDEASREVTRLRREAARRGSAAARADRKRSKRGLARGDSDARERIDRARATGADGRQGALAGQMQSRLDRAERELEDFGVRKTYDLGLRLPGVPSRRKQLLFVPAAILPLGDGRVLEHPALTIGSEDRIALTGPNGAGKSTLVRHLLARLADRREQIVYLPQEVSADDARALVARFRQLPFDRQGRVLTIVSALGSRPPRLLASQLPSPGEVRKLLLAVGAIDEPNLIVMDEPTNHLDLPAIGCLEDALAGCQAALLLVSHDRRFLERLTTVRWTLVPADVGSRLEVG